MNVFAVDTCAYLVTGQADVGILTTALYVLDISNPVTLVEVGALKDAPWEARALTVVGNYAYIATDTAGLRVIGISNPIAPTEVGGYAAEVTAFAKGVSAVGNYAYVAYGRAGLRVVDVSNPSAPIELSRTLSPDYRDVTWEEAVRLLHSGQVVEAGQSHSLSVGLLLKDGTILHTVEPTIDAIWYEIQKCGDVCAGIKFQTE